MSDDTYIERSMQGNSFAEHCERMDAAREKEREAVRRSPCPHSPQFTISECSVVTEHTRKDRCDRCGKTWFY